MLTKIKVFAIVFLLSVPFLFSAPLVFAEQDTPSETFSYAIKIGDKTFLPLASYCLENGIRVEWDGLARRAALSKGEHFLTLMPDVALANVDGAVRPIDLAPRMQFGAVLIPESFTKEHWWPWRGDSERSETLPLAAKQGVRKQRIIIDPGHGGLDAGARGAFGVLEKDLTLVLSEELARQIEGLGFEAVLTRTDDHYISLEDRSRFVTLNGGDLFVSVHANSSRSSTASGFEIYYLSETVDDYARAVAAYENASAEFEKSKVETPSVDPTVWDIILTEKRRESIMLAKMISAQITDSGLTRNRGVKGAEFRVLMNTKVPALLLEVGFLTNLEEARKLSDASYQTELVSVLTEGILGFLKEYEKTNGFTV